MADRAETPRAVFTALLDEAFEMGLPWPGETWRRAWLDRFDEAEGALDGPQSDLGRTEAPDHPDGPPGRQNGV